MIRTKVSYEHLASYIAEKRRSIEEKELASRIAACKEKVSQSINRNLEACQQAFPGYTLQLLTGQYDYQTVLQFILKDLRVGELAKSVSAFVSADMQDYFGCSAPSLEKEFSINTRSLLPPAYTGQVLQEYVNTFRFTKAMGKAVNKVCRKSLAQVGLPWALQRLAKRVDFGALLLREFHCRPESQKHRLQKQVQACIHGVLSHLAVQLKQQYHEAIVRVFYQFYDEQGEKDFALASFSKYQYSNRRKRKKQNDLYEIQRAV
ncbi:hypothetical protein P22_3911 [Propionispora sp. 2/2-37]|uniref:hypothetical protein n=1 Tax=Propionispora sp. 2/2-37 TaxID=1677858 RepID=UPI0006BB6063|nr:hypothetical protein [Propionispora sp. 2/2-37]CUH97767.1 hypothetical protein P22_3911 [Propionispora sp. 2/2-37]